MAQRAGQLRIIGGKFRSRRLRFSALKDLRPTPDAVRETLFNWLRDDVDDSSCLDLFAGSGALGLEAVSRGARHVTFVDSNRQATRQISENGKVLGITSDTTVVCAKAERFLDQAESPFDIIFLDPPFESSLLPTCIAALDQNNLVGVGSLIYAEMPRAAPPLPVPATWHIIRDTDRGQVRSLLIVVT